MISLLIITIQIVLAFFIASTLYLVGVYHLKMFAASTKEKSTPSTAPSHKHHLALVFNDYINEEQLMQQLHFLQSQGYNNFSAYFFINDPYVEVNNMENVRIIRPTVDRPGKFGLLHLVKSYFVVKPDAVLVLNPQSTLDENYLTEMNTQLCNGYRVVQSQVTIKNNSGNPATRDFYDTVDRKAHQAHGFSSALRNHGFAIHADLFLKLNFYSYIHSDKELQAELITRSEKIAFAHTATLTENFTEKYKSFSKKAAQYLFDYHLGFNLLLAGIRNPNFEKILFGINFMRPPLLVMLVASVALSTVNLLWMPYFGGLLWLSFPGMLCSIILLTKPLPNSQFFTYIRHIVARKKTESRMSAARLF